MNWDYDDQEDGFCQGLGTLFSTGEQHWTKNGTASRLCRKDQRHTSEMSSERHGQYHKMLMYLFGEFRDKSLWTGKASWSEKGKVKAEYYVEHMVRDLWDSNHRLLSSNCVPDSVLTIWNILIKKEMKIPAFIMHFGDEKHKREERKIKKALRKLKKIIGEK